MSNVKYTKAALSEAIGSSKSWREVASKFGAKSSGGMLRHLARRARAFGVDYSHFHEGKTYQFTPPLTMESLLSKLVVGADMNTYRVRLHLVRFCLKEDKCENCGLTEWLGEDPPLQLDHVNGDRYDWRLENLKVLCANCHQIKTRKNNVKAVYRCIDCQIEISRMAERCIKHSNAARPGNRPGKRKFEFTKEELENLVWSRPTSVISKQLGVSDKAIEKRCRLLGVKKPPVGYWNGKSYNLS